MKRLFLFSVFATVVALATPQHARAIAFSLSPSSQNVSIGPSITFDVVVSGLGGLQLGDYDLDITFNPTILAATGVVFGPFLGSPLDSINGFDFSTTPGVIDLFEVSFLSTASLAALQTTSSFVLATLTFTPQQLGNTTLTFTQSLAGDGSGNPLTGENSSASVAVTPEPGSLLLLGSGLLAMVAHRRRNARSV